MLTRLLVRHRRGDDDENEILLTGIVDRMLDAGRQIDDVVAADDTCLVADLHQSLAFEHVVDLLLHLVTVPFHIGHRLVHRDAVVEMLRLESVGRRERLRQRAAEMIRILPPRRLRDVLERCLAFVLRKRGLTSPVSYRAGNAGQKPALYRASAAITPRRSRADAPRRRHARRARTAYSPRSR